MINSAHLMLASFLFFAKSLCIAQPAPVKWNFRADTTNPNEAMLFIKADIAPGWHLYSQYVKEGGPIPTKLKFAESKDFTAVGKPEEKGDQVRFYDDIYEMEIICYNQEVTFLQKISLHNPIRVIKGTIEYMTCNNEVCIPDEQEFDIVLKP